MNKQKNDNNYTGIGIGIAGGGLYGLSKYLKKNTEKQISKNTKIVNGIKKDIEQKEKDISVAAEYIDKIKNKYGADKSYDSLVNQDKKRLFNNAISLPGIIESKKDEIGKLKKEITLKENNNRNIFKRELRNQEHEKKVLREKIRQIDNKIKKMDKLKDNVKKVMHDIVEEKKRVEGKTMSKSEYDNFVRRLKEKSKENEFFHKVIEQNKASIKQRGETIKKIEEINEKIKKIEQELERVGWGNIKEPEIINLRSKYLTLEHEQYELNVKLSKVEKESKELDKFIEEVESKVKDTNMLDKTMLASSQEALNYTKNKELPTWQNILNKSNSKMKAANYMSKAGIGIGIAGASKFLYDKYKEKSSYKQ